MSGHSKWNNIKHKKEKSDAAKAKIFTKHLELMNMDCEMVQMHCMSMRLVDTIRHKFKQRLKFRFRR